MIPSKAAEKAAKVRAEIEARKEVKARIRAAAAYHRAQMERIKNGEYIR